MNLTESANTVVNNDWRSGSAVLNWRSVNKVCESSSLVNYCDLKLLCNNDADKKCYAFEIQGVETVHIVE